MNVRDTEVQLYFETIADSQFFSEYFQTAEYALKASIPLIIILLVLSPLINKNAVDEIDSLVSKQL